MENIRNVPLFLSIIVTLLVGVWGIASNTGSQELYTRMIICLILSYLIGLYFRNTISGINGEIEKRKEEERQELLRQEEEARLEHEAKNGSSSSSVDYKVDDDFITMELAQAVKSSLAGDKEKF